MEKKHIGTDKQQEADSLLQDTTSHIQCLDKFLKPILLKFLEIIDRNLNGEEEKITTGISRRRLILSYTMQLVISNVPKVQNLGCHVS